MFLHGVFVSYGCMVFSCWCSSMLRVLVWCVCMVFGFVILLWCFSLMFAYVVFSMVFFVWCFASCLFKYGVVSMVF